VIDLNQFAAQTPLDDPAPAGPLRDPVTIAAAVCRAQVEEEARQEGVQGQEEPRGFFATLDLAKFDTGLFLDEEPPPPSWIFDNSFLAGTVGFVAGAQGTGKSRFLLQIGAAIATGHRGFLGDALHPARKGKVLAIFCEESRPVLWRRIRRMFRAFCPIQAESEDGKSVTLLPHPAEADFRANFIAIPAAGQDLRLVEMAGGEARPSRNFHELLALAKSIPGLALTILDPQSRLYGQNENDNNAATTFCSVLERLAQETGAGVLCCAHVGKGGGKKKDGSFDVDAALHQDAMRGASGFSAAARWQLNLASLPGKAAKDRGVASNAGDGQFLAGKVCKANDAPLGEVFYLRRDHDGTLRQIAPERAEEEAQVEEAVLAWIKAKIKDQAEKGLPSLTVPMLKDFSQEWGSIAGASRARILEVARAAVNNGALLLEPGRNGSGRAVEFLRVESAEPANQPADDLAGSAAPEREPAGEPAKSKPAEPAALSKTSRPVHNILGNHDKENRPKNEPADDLAGSLTTCNHGTIQTGQTGLSKERENVSPTFLSLGSLDPNPKTEGAE